MTKNVILRPVFNRPEMLQLSIDYEIEARRAAGVKQEEYFTFFLVEYGAPEKIAEIARSYPFPGTLRFRNRWWRTPRKRRYGITRSLIEGMKEGFRTADQHVIVIEDDILLHSSYFQYIQAVLQLPGAENFSAISAVSPFNDGDPHIVHRGNHYAPLAPLIAKTFWDAYIRHYANERYYQNRKKTIVALNWKYRAYWDNGYKMGSRKTYDNHDGLINRLVDAARIERNMFVIEPEVDRQIHIGVYGTNTPGRSIPGDTFEERLKELRTIVLQNRLANYTESKVLDFRSFSDCLDNWTGNMQLR